MAGRKPAGTVGPMAVTGRNSNITWYAERDRGGSYICAEVLRADYEGQGPSRAMARRQIPKFHVRVSRSGLGQVCEFTYEPVTHQPPGPLNTKTLTRLVREHLDTPRGDG